MRAQRHAHGSVRFDKRRGTWNFLFYDHGKRRSRLIGTKQQYPSKASAWKVAETLRKVSTVKTVALPTVIILVEAYRAEKMPTRIDTRRSYEVWIRNHILPRWGDCLLSELEPRPVEMWLTSLPLAPKSRAHIRGVLSILWDFAAWRGDVP
jgi:integrase